MTTSSSPPPPEGDGRRGDPADRTDPDRPGQPGRPDEPSGDRLSQLSPGLICGWLVVGLVCGWLLRRIAGAIGVEIPAVSWTQVLVLALVAALLAGTAIATRRSVQRARADLEAQHAVNRLVLARACVLVGALLLGGYLGHAISWLGSPSALAGERILRSVLAAAAGTGVLICGLWLERACRVPAPPSDT